MYCRIHSVYARAGVQLHVGGKSIEDQQSHLIYCNDQLMERIAISLDEARGVRKQYATQPIVVRQSISDPNAIATSWNRKVRLFFH